MEELKRLAHRREQLYLAYWLTCPHYWGDWKRFKFWANTDCKLGDHRHSKLLYSLEESDFGRN